MYEDSHPPDRLERAAAAAARAEMYRHEASDEYDRNLSFEAAEEAALDAAI